MSVTVSTKPRPIATEVGFHNESSKLAGILTLRTGANGGHLKLTPEQAIELGAAMVEWGNEQLRRDPETERNAA